LSALHPRYEESQRSRVPAELLPRLVGLCEQTARANIALTIDAEEADRLVLSLDLFSALAQDRRLAGWDGLGLAVQAYQKRAPAVITWLPELARATGRRIPVRLVKGAYWDSEVKWAQEKGLGDFPVFTRKAATDLCYRACAARLFGGGDRLFGQFATHNPRTAAEVIELAGPIRRYEFQKLHGMGDSLYELLAERLGKRFRCRVYAPVGDHRNLLPYLVRRLLENGANTSFVPQVSDAGRPLEGIVADPTQILTDQTLAVVKPSQLFGERRNASGLDLADRRVLDGIVVRLTLDRDAVPAEADRHEPADAERRVGHQRDSSTSDVANAVGTAQTGYGAWSHRPAAERAAVLEAAADLFEKSRLDLLSLIVREGGRTIGDALSEVREATDFLRYYAARARADFAAPMALPGPTGEHNSLRLEGRGVFSCISPWNFPLAIFVGQLSAALASGNTVVAKPAEQTSLTAARAVALLHEAGVPSEALQLVYGGAAVGMALVEDPRLAGVAFTGSTATGKDIARRLAAGPRPIVPFIAETGGVNAMIADSSALAEQLVRDVVISAFQSAGQRCSALRVLFMQDDGADSVLEKLAGAMAELRVGDPADPATNVGPVIDARARDKLAA